MYFKNSLSLWGPYKQGDRVHCSGHTPLLPALRIRKCSSNKNLNKKIIKLKFTKIPLFLLCFIILDIIESKEYFRNFFPGYFNGKFEFVFIVITLAFFVNISD